MPPKLLYNVERSIPVVSSSTPTVVAPTIWWRRASERWCAIERPEGIVDFTPDADLYLFESKWFQSSVGPIHYVDEGAGRPLVMFHGNPDWSFLYRCVITALRGQFGCIAMDDPGLGLSVHPGAGDGGTPGEHAAVVGELIDHLELHDAVFVGSDWGGPIGPEVASKRSDRFTGLVIGNTWAWPPETGMIKFFSRLMSSAPLQRLIKKRNFFISPAMKRTIDRDISDREFQHYVEVAPTPDHRQGIAEFPKQIRAAEPFLAVLEQRVLVEFADTPMLSIRGTKDPVFRGILPGWQQRFPNAQVVRLDSAGHYLQEDESEAIAATIAETFGG